MRYIKLLLLTFFTVSSASVLAIESHPEVEQYVDKLVNDATNVLSDTKLTEDAKITKARALMSENLDLDWMAKYTLGRHKKNLNVAQLKEFKQIYANYVIKSYTDLIKNYKGEQVKIKNVHPLDEDEFIVRTDLMKSTGQPPVKVDYLVRKISLDKKQIIKVADIITEGVSMLNSQQAEFNSILMSGGFEELLNNLKKKQ